MMMKRDLSEIFIHKNTQGGVDRSITKQQQQQQNYFEESAIFCVCTHFPVTTNLYVHVVVVADKKTNNAWIGYCLSSKGVYTFDVTHLNKYTKRKKDRKKKFVNCNRTFSNGWTFLS